MRPEAYLSQQLLQVLGEDDYVRFTQEFGGTRVYVPYKCREGSDLVNALGMAACEKLSQALAPATIRVPLARRERALYYRARDLSNAKIARKLGMTETGVNRLFATEATVPVRPSLAPNDAQLAFALDEPDDTIPR